VCLVDGPIAHLKIYTLGLLCLPRCSRWASNLLCTPLYFSLFFLARWFLHHKRDSPHIVFFTMDSRSNGSSFSKPPVSQTSTVITRNRAVSSKKTRNRARDNLQEKACHA